MEYATLFPLDRICGRWKSRGKSPPVRVYREGHTYRIALAYRWGAVLTATLYRNGQGTWAELPERVQVAYDEENERLVPRARLGRGVCTGLQGIRILTRTF